MEAKGYLNPTDPKPVTEIAYDQGLVFNAITCTRHRSGRAGDSEAPGAARSNTSWEDGRCPEPSELSKVIRQLSPTCYRRQGRC